VFVDRKERLGSSLERKPQDRPPNSDAASGGVETRKRSYAALLPWGRMLGTRSGNSHHGAPGFVRDVRDA
jgi:hypothetical protein